MLFQPETLNTGNPCYNLSLIISKEIWIISLQNSHHKRLCCFHLFSLPFHNYSVHVMIMESPWSWYLEGYNSCNTGKMWSTHFQKRGKSIGGVNFNSCAGLEIYLLLFFLSHIGSTSSRRSQQLGQYLLVHTCNKFG